MVETKGLSTWIKEEDVPFEQQLVKDPSNVDIWIEYYESKAYQKDHTSEQLIFVLSRALQNVADPSEDLWLLLLNLKIDSTTSSDDSAAVIQWFENAFGNGMGKSLKCWKLYLTYLISGGHQQKEDFTASKFEQCLWSLPMEDHFEIWPLYLQFGSQLQSFHVYKKYLSFKMAFDEAIKEGPSYEEVLHALITFVNEGDYQQQEVLIEVFEKYMTSKDILSTIDNEFEIYRNYLTVLSKFKMSDRLDKTVERSLLKFPDQRVEIMLKWVKYYKNANDHARVKLIFDQGIEQCDNIRDFTTIYESYLEFEETLVQDLMENNNENEDETNEELDAEMTFFETLMNKRKFMINDIYLKQNTNNIDTWLKRVALFDEKTQVKEILETYVEAIMTINPQKAGKGLSRLWIPYIRVYESHGDLNTARTIMNKCVNVPFNDIDDLVEVWLEWSNMELRASADDDALEQSMKILEKALHLNDGETSTITELAKIDYNDSTLPVQTRVCKSFKLWSFYLDLVESSGDVEKTSRVYENMIDLKIARPITVINYALFYEEHEMFERSLSVFEKGLKLFQYPIVYEIWNIYLSKILKFSEFIKISNERIRDIFDECLDNCPLDNMHAVILLYADFEEKQCSNIGKSLKIYNNHLQKLNAQSRVIVYKAYVAKAMQYLSLSEVRPLYEEIINDDKLPIDNDLIGFVKDFVTLEMKLKDLQRARFLLKNYYEILSQSQKGGLIKNLEEFWKAFELNNGDEETFKEMLRFKRSCEVRFGKSEDKVLQGFVKSTHGPKVSSINASEEKKIVNPHAIDIEIEDSSDEDSEQEQEQD